VKDPIVFDRLHMVSSTFRPLDPRYPTNRATLSLMVAAAVAAGGVAGVQNVGAAQIVRTALWAAFAVFGCWALARELAPDDNAGAFVSAGFGFVSYWLVRTPNLFPLFIAVFMLRIVNRSTGVKTKLVDSILVLLLTIWASYWLHTPLLALIGALAFASDAVLSDGWGTQWVFAGSSVVAAVLLALVDPHASLHIVTRSSTWIAAVVVSVLWWLDIATTRVVSSLGDVSGKPLSAARVRCGMLIGWLIAAQGLITNRAMLEASSLLWATLAGLLVGRLAHTLVHDRDARGAVGHHRHRRSPP